MHAGGGLGGYIASRDEARYAAEYPTLLNSITETVDGRPAFGLMLFHQSSYGSRELGKDWTGNSTYLWAIGAAVYMALLGPEGFAELGRLIMARTAELAAALADVPGVAVLGDGPRWKEVVVDVSGTGRDVASIHAALLARGIFGGIALSPTRALYAATEMTTPEDIAALAAALTEIVA
jgi:glycine dehydrogenase subunit 1